MIQRHTLSSRSVKTFPEQMTGNQLIFETKALNSKALDDGKAMGEVVISTVVNAIEDVEIGRQKLIPGDRTLFWVPGGITGPFQFTGELFPWIEGSYLITVWASTVVVSPPSTEPQECAVDGTLIDFVALPNGDGVALNAGMAVFTAGETAFSLPSESSPDYQQSYSVAGDKFWGVGARSLERFDSGRFSFVSGSGRSMLGLVADFPSVDFKLFDWAWYVHSPEQVYAFERPPGQALRSVGGFPWSPEKPLSLEIAESNTVRFGIGDQVVYESSIAVMSPLFFAAVLGPQAFVVNCLRI